MSEAPDRPAIEISPTAVAIRATSTPAKPPEFHLNLPKRRTGHGYSYEVTTVTAVNMHTADTMRHISDNNVACARITSRERVVNQAGVATILSASLLALLWMLGPLVTPAMATGCFASLCAVFGGIAITREIMAKRKDEQPAELPPKPE